jgi:hypothetical protein
MPQTDWFPHPPDPADPLAALDPFLLSKLIGTTHPERVERTLRVWWHMKANGPLNPGGPAPRDYDMIQRLVTRRGNIRRRLLRKYIREGVI